MYSSEIFKAIYYARYLSFCNQHKAALQTLISCKPLLELGEGITMLTQYCGQLSEEYAYLGNYKEAYDNFKIMHEYRISSANDSTMNVIADFKAEQESKIQQAENNRLEAEKTQLQTIITSLVVGLILAVLLVFVIIMALKIKHRSNQQLSDVNKKLYRSIAYAQRIQKAAITAQKGYRRLYRTRHSWCMPVDAGHFGAQRVLRFRKRCRKPWHHTRPYAQLCKIYTHLWQSERNWRRYGQPLEKGDMVYTFSDGIQDQPGGEIINTSNHKSASILGRKFSSKGLVNFLKENYYRSTETQCRLLEKTINDWRNGRPLIDDMTLIGIRV